MFGLRTVPRFSCLVPWLLVLTLAVAVSAEITVVPLWAELPQEALQAVPRRGHAPLFYINETETFLAPKDKSLWDEPASLLEHRGWLRWWHRRGPEWVEFRFIDTSSHVSRDLTPVLPCHSEVWGPGGQVALHAEIGRSLGMDVPLGLQVNTWVAALVWFQGVNFVTAKSVQSLVWCPISHGEIGQLFLSGTRFFDYTTEVRLHEYEWDAMLLEPQLDFIRKAPERKILKDGLGEWVCATDRVVDLQCFDLTLFA